MPNQYVIRINTIDDDGVISSELLVKTKHTFISESLADAIDAKEDAVKWVKGDYTICILKELNNL